MLHLLVDSTGYTVNNQILKNHIKILSVKIIFTTFASHGLLIHAWNKSMTNVFISFVLISE